MIIITLVIAHLIAKGGSSVPYLLLPRFSNSENNEHLDATNYLNRSVSPCNNFYEYSCGSWISNTEQSEYEPFWNQWQSVNKKVLNRIQSILKSQHFTPKYLVKAQNMYNACISNKKSEMKYVSNLKVLINNLGGWPIINHTWNASDYDWIVNVASITRIFGIYPLLKLNVFVDLYNTSQHSIYIERGELNLPQPILINSQKYKHFIKAYQIWILETIRYLFPNKIPSNELRAEITEMIAFEIQLAKLHLYKDKSEKLSVDRLSKQIPIKWNEVFDRFFIDTNTNVNSDDKVIIRNRRYLIKLLRLINKTKVKTVANYAIWSVVKSLSRDVSKHMRQLNFMMDNTILGIKKDMLRSEECIRNVLTYMDIALIPKYSKLYLPSSVFEEVSNMTENIKLEFIKLLRKNSWLDNKTRSSAAEKINALKYIIAYPSWLNNNSLLEKIFDEVKISSNHFTNILQLRSLKMKTALQKLKQPVDFEWPGSLFEVNAYYSILQNTIFIPVGLLEPPFFTISGPRTLNYGALGSLIGHEISHALDVLGRHADRNGNIKNWWSEKDIEKYENALDCLKKQYNSYQTNGITTIGENIADNVGLQISYNAYKNSKSKYNVGSNMNEFSQVQLFFISFSQIWCEISTENELINEDEHAPVKVRVQGTVRNMKAFNQAFYCKNEKEICTLW